MNKQKFTFLLVMWVLTLTLSGCTKSISNNTDNDAIIWDNEVVIWENLEVNEENTEVNEIKDIENEEEDTENTIKNDEEKSVKDEDTYEYDNKPYSFTIQIPNNWNFVENEYGFAVLVYTPEDWDVRENLWISVQTPQIDTNLEDYYKESMQKIAEISKWFKEIKTSDIEINWLKGKSTIYETIQNDTNIKSQQTVFIDSKNYVYILQYTATKDTFNKYLNGINTIIKSFKILN
jgi:hypothetical protein